MLSAGQHQSKLSLVTGKRNIVPFSDTRRLDEHHNVLTKGVASLSNLLVSWWKSHEISSQASIPAHLVHAL